MPWNDGLAGPALDIAGSNDSPLRVLAGPGTGKSFAMKRRVARLVEEGADPERVLAVTFTRNAARSLIEDLHGLGVAGCNRIQARTLHAHCFGLLASADVFAYVGRHPRPMLSFVTSSVLQFECKPMLWDLVRAGGLGKSRNITARVRAFEAAWARLQSDVPGWPHDNVDQRLQTLLVEWLRFHEAMLIGELVPEALRFLRNNPASVHATSFDHVVVDEYQDLNRAEQEIVDRLAGAGSIAVVGDVDQSIYSFRHANPEGIVTFDTSHPGTVDKPLVQCRRCPTGIVALADALIRKNHGVGAAARLHPGAANAGTVRIVQWASLDEEAEGVAQYVSSLIARGLCTPEEILVLTPRRMIGYKVRDALERLNVPAHSFYHEEMLEGAAAQEAMTLLALLANEEDRVSLRWWLGNGSPSGRAGAYAALRAQCEASGASPRAVLQDIKGGTITVAGTGALDEPFAELVARLGALAGLNLPDLIEALLPSGVTEVEDLRAVALSLEPDCENVEELASALRTASSQVDLPEEGDFVRVMSLHKSKGLTSKAVVVAGCIEGLTPTVGSSLTGAARQRSVEEGRRLFYVAMTRATEYLTLSSAAEIELQTAYRIGAVVSRRRGATVPTVASRFLGELGASTPPALLGEDWMQAGFP